MAPCGKINSKAPTRGLCELCDVGKLAQVLPPSSATVVSAMAYDPAYLKGAGEALEKLVAAVCVDLPVWGRGVAYRSSKPVKRVGWYAELPEGFAGVEFLRASARNRKNRGGVNHPHF